MSHYNCKCSIEHCLNQGGKSIRTFPSTPSRSQRLSATRMVANKISPFAFHTVRIDLQLEPVQVEFRSDQPQSSVEKH